MTQAHIDFQIQLQSTTDLITRSLFIDSPVLFLDAVNQDQPKNILNKLSIIIFLQKIEALQK